VAKGPEFDKAKFSKHQRESFELGRLDHDVSEERAAEAVLTPDLPDLIEIHGGRLVYWTRRGGRRLKTVVSAATSAGFSVARIVTSHWREFPWVVVSSRAERSDNEEL